MYRAHIVAVDHHCISTVSIVLFNCFSTKLELYGLEDGSVTATFEVSYEYVVSTCRSFHYSS